MQCVGHLIIPDTGFEKRVYCKRDKIIHSKTQAPGEAKSEYGQ
jgi:hypothetical protein